MKPRSGLASAQEVWINPNRLTSEKALSALHFDGVHDASERFRRFQPTLQRLFPELTKTGGVVESPLIDASGLADALDIDRMFGKVLVKGDHLLPIAGSIKARGGFHAVLAFAEEVARKEGLLAPEDYRFLASSRAKETFSKYTLAVGSTGNLGLSVGTIGAALGFRTLVHMSSEAKGWKKQRLTGLGVEVVEHTGDYEQALAAGRALCADDPCAFFIDDEDSLPLLYGYSTAIARLKNQMEEKGLVIDEEHPLFVYVPCGVGGAPSGIALGLNLAFGSAVHCFYAEPVEAPCVLVAMKSGKEDFPSVYDAGLTGRTEADGLAVPRASRWAVDVSKPLISGIFTVSDEVMFRHMSLAYQILQTKLEPSACAGFSGPASIPHRQEFEEYLSQHRLHGKMEDATHIVWATGGSLIPDALFKQLIDQVR